MTFKTRSRRTAGRISGAVGAACAHGLLGLARAVLAVAVIAVIAGVIVMIRLTQGPVVLPGLGHFLVERVNASSDTIRVDLAQAVLDLGDGSVPSGLEFRNVRVASRDGVPLFTVPRLRASFDFTDLIVGNVRPTRISIVSADAQFIRTPDGRIRFGLGGGDGVSLASGRPATTSEEGAEAISRLIDGIVGDADLPPEMAKLRVLEVVNARLIFSDRMAGGRAVTRNATLRVKRDAGGATALLDIASTSGAAPEEIVRVVADRRQGSGTTSVRGRFGKVDLKKLASFLPALKILDDVDALAAGEVAARFGRDGWPTEVSGRLHAERGRLTIGPETHPFDVASLAFRANMARGRIEVTEGLYAAPGGSGRATGLIGLEHDGSGSVTAARVQMDLADIVVRRGQFFEEDIGFDHGQVVAGWTPDGSAVEIADSWLGRDDFNLRFSGRVSVGPEGLQADIRARAETLQARDLVRYWPTIAAPNARAWVQENISQGVLHDLTAEVRLRPDREILALTAGFSDLTTTYIDGMTPIREGAGELFMDLDEMHLNLRAGKVDAAGGSISLAGSSLVFSDFDEPITPADIRLAASGPTAAVLALIDQQPLGLVQALGLELGTVAGAASVTARVRFPLLAALRVQDVLVDARADLRDARLNLALGDAERVEVRSDLLNIEADVERMRLSGDAVVDGAAVNLDWREDYSTRPGSRQVRLTGWLTPAVLGRMGVGDGYLTGRARLAAELDQRGNEPMRFELDADLQEAGLRIAPLGWEKAPGTAGTLRAAGSLGDETTIDSLDLEAPGLKVSGTVALRPDGGLRRALLREVRVPGRIDASVSVELGPGGIQNVRIAGSLLDISGDMDAGGEDASPQPMLVRLELSRLKISETISINAASGSIQRKADGAVSGRITGAFGPDAPVTVSVDIPARGEGRVTLNSPNAGAALFHAEIYRGATGGSLQVNARIPEESGAGVTGQARIENVTVRSEATFRNVLEDGGLKSAGEAVSGSGLSFRSISVPFRYADGVMTVTDAIAVSPILALKMTGTVNENTEVVDLVGVLSPAYALTGALNEIPLVGQILSGGRGEGILAMTFTLKGAMRDPRFSVNPLSLLAPGVLRKLFTGGSGETTGTFKPQGTQQYR